MGNVDKNKLVVAADSLVVCKAAEVWRGVEGFFVVETNRGTNLSSLDTG